MDDIKVLVVDDSALMRNLVSRIVENAPGMTVVGKAMNGKFALEKIPLVNPDIIILDIEMPEMNGIQFLEERKKQGITIPVIMLSSIAKKGAAVTMQCLALGASDFITKPSGSDSPDLHVIANTLVEYITSYGGKYKHSQELKARFGTDIPSARSMASSISTSTTSSSITKESETPTRISFSFMHKTEKQPLEIKPLREGGRIEIIAIGISTGGPNALREVFKNIDPNLKQPILVVQHMPAGFTEEFANSLNAICPLEVKEASDGDLVKSGRILIAPGNKHIYVEKKSLATVVRLSDDDQRNGHRPSADVLFESVAKNFQNKALGVIMTGMGRDGAAELAEMRKQGAWTLGQDEESSIVYGMPRVAFELGAVQKQVPLSEMAKAISDIAREHSI
ncbi:MAG: chemotaxis response regulator protein-glutamate methylesterase [Treponemataceae bacterium]|nr:chemotaxis response regulator protein-glutamate methylesterase [Spirochaetales bacterium]MDY6030273.1 chemotaxis response regulator protein-glutamate methylesterase [Treponemataceae bacterium]